MPPRSNFFEGRHAGLLIPLFSFPSTQSWGIGEIGDLPALAEWLRDAGLDFVQLLPFSEMAEGQHSPYSASSAMAMDPIFISVYDVEDFAALGGEAALLPAARAKLERVRGSASVQYDEVRRLKTEALEAAFDRFLEKEWRASTPRAARLVDYVERQAWWLDDYALFRAIGAEHEQRPWMEWDRDLRRRNAGAMQVARNRLQRQMLFYQYLQWIADSQWTAMRERLDGVGLFGDFPFTVGANSADVWARQDEFILDASVGVPPDAFSETGQNWGLPPYRWDVIQAGNYRWLRDRARRLASLCDGYRVDHLVGFYRTFVIPGDDSEHRFEPPEEEDQLAQGEKVLAAILESGACVTAEDLGTVPDFVRASLSKLKIPGYRVLRWEREWDRPGQPFIDPVCYPSASVATSGTHDTEPMATWWNEAEPDERQRLREIPSLNTAIANLATSTLTREIRDALLETLFASGSDLLILPVQDVFGWTDRINVPATVTADNWTYRLPWPVDRLRSEAPARQRANALRTWSQRSGRMS